jgi:hypothetical protein
MAQLTVNLAQPGSLLGEQAAASDSSVAYESASNK